MRIEQRAMLLDGAFMPILVKEKSRNYPKVKYLDDPWKIVKVMNDMFYMDRLAEEYVYLIALTAKNQAISFFEVSHGICTCALTGMREILIRSLLCGAVNVILVHNHPSGDSAPSGEDEELTGKLKEALDLVGISFCDHIIIGRSEFYSFRNEGRL